MKSTQQLFLSLQKRAQDGQTLSVKDFLDSSGITGYALVLLILALPSALPVPAPAYSTPFGIAIVLVGAQIVVGLKQLWLPRFLLKITLSPQNAQKLFGFALKCTGVLNRFVSPRMESLARGVVLRLIGAFIVAFGVFMCLPIPLTNTLPAVAVFCWAIALMERDGLLVCIGLVLTPIFFAAYFIGFSLIITFLRTKMYEYGIL